MSADENHGLWSPEIYAFCNKLDEKLRLKYETSGLRGVRERLQALMNSLMDALQMTIQMHDVLAARYTIA